MEHQEALELWRQSIRQIDEDIVRLASQRMDLALKIGRYKRDQKLPVKDFRVEKLIVEKARKQAAGLGLEPDFAEQLMTVLIRYSVEKQDELTRNREAKDGVQTQNVLIIGGSGKMGQWYAQFYQSLGFSVSIHDPAFSGDAFPEHPDLDKDLNRFELIVIATPLLITNQILKDLAKRKPSATIIETSSLKDPLAEGYQAALDAGLKLASIHPMFGPDTDMLAGKNIIFCESPGLQSAAVRDLYFSQTSAHLVSIPLQEHDREMQYALGLSHFLNLFHGMLLQASHAPLDRLREVGGPTFREQLKVTETVVTENSDLSFEIQTLGSFRTQLLQIIDGSFNQLKRLIMDQRKEEFHAKMNDVRQFFKPQSAKNEANAGLAKAEAKGKA